MKPLLLSVSLLAAVNAAPNVIADYRIRNPDITPALGRGYSLTSYDVLSTCLQFEEKTQPTYTYDYEMLEFTHAGAQQSSGSASLQASVSWPFIKGTISASVDHATTDTRKSHFVSTRMATERYYSSINEQTATLMPSALALIQRGDLVGFFQACGSGYIRSVRRTAELAAVFEYTSSSVETSKEMAGELTAKVVGTGGDGASASLRSNSTNSDSRTKITIKGFGLGLNLAGADSLVAHNLEDYNKAVKFAFKSMQNVDVGMIHGVEVVSWMSNLEFQNAVNFRKTEEIEWVLPKNMAGEEIVGAHKIRSVVPGNQIAAAVVGPNGVITSPAVFDKVFVESVEVKAITMINAEFITGLEAYYRKESYTVTKFVACQQEVKSLMALNKGNYYLQDHTQMELTKKSRENAWTVEQAWAIMTNLAHLNTRVQSLKNFAKHFYGKCASTIVKYSNDGSMTRYWWDIPECMPTSDGTPSSPGIPTIGCLEGGRDFTFTPGDSTAGTPGVLKCEAQPEVAVGSTSTTGMSNFLDRYCMPKIDHSLKPVAPKLTTGSEFKA